jgi:methylglutaconyl-CoA hydratase
MYRNLKLTCDGRLARLTLDRPERRNAFSAELMRELIAAAAELAARRDVDAVVVSGSGGVFSAGADLKDATRWAGARRYSSSARPQAWAGAWRAPGKSCRK